MDEQHAAAWYAKICLKVTQHQSTYKSINVNTIVINIIQNFEFRLWPYICVQLHLIIIIYSSECLNNYYANQWVYLLDRGNQ